MYWLDMAINLKKSSCVRVGSRCDTHCMNTKYDRNHVVHFVRVKYTLNAPSITPKGSFQRAANCIGKIERIASEESVFQLITEKCLPIFTAHRIASAVLATAIPSVCPSVCPSVRLSHAGIVSKRRHVARCSLHCQTAKCVYFCRNQKYFPGTTPSP